MLMEVQMRKQLPVHEFVMLSSPLEDKKGGVHTKVAIKQQRLVVIYILRDKDSTSHRFVLHATRIRMLTECRVHRHKHACVPISK
jgi:hypothetical protein